MDRQNSIKLSMLYSLTNLLKVVLQRFICLVKVIIHNDEVIHAWLFS